MASRSFTPEVLTELFNFATYVAHNRHLHPYDALRIYLNRRGVTDEDFDIVSLLVLLPEQRWG